MTFSPRLFSSLAVAAGLLFSIDAQAALGWAPTGSYPRRSNQGLKTIASNPFNKDTINTGINRDDCEDTSQEWQLYYDPASLSGVAYIDIYAQTGDTSGSCEDITVRPGGTAQTCYKIRRLGKADFTSKVVVIHPWEIIAAVQSHKDATTLTSDSARTVCEADTSGNSPVAIVVWSVPFTDETTVQSGGSLALQTSYDISGPAAPTGFYLGAGNTIINAHFDTFSQTAYPDFKGMRAYCWPRTDFDAAGVETATVDTATTDTAADTTVTDTATSSTDSATDDATDSSTDSMGDTGTAATDSSTDETSTTTTDTGATTANDPGGVCPANIPWSPNGGGFAPPGLVPCADRGQLSTELTLENLTNDQPYAVAISTYDNWGNSGPLTPVKCITPKLTTDFFTAYKDAGGQGGGGYCSFNGSNTGLFGLGLSALGLALVGRAVRRRNRNDR